MLDVPLDLKLVILSSFVTVFSLVYPEDKWVLSKLNLPVFVFFKNIFKVL